MTLKELQKIMKDNPTKAEIKKIRKFIRHEIEEWQEFENYFETKFGIK